MNGDLQSSPPWSTRRWTLVVLAVFALHLGALFLFSKRGSVAPRQVQNQQVARWLTTPESARQTLDSILVSDPTLFAMVSPRGFSGAAWLRPQSPKYQSGEFTQSERTLPQPTQSLGGAFQQLAAPHAAPVFDLVRKPDLAAAPPAVPQPALRNRSRLMIEGPASRLKLAQSPALKSWTHTDVLNDTRVQVRVSPEGLVFSTLLAGAANSKDPVQRAADLQALELAHQLRFESRAKQGGAPVEGVLVFQWHTVEPPGSATP